MESGAVAERIRILLVDDHSLFRRGLADVLSTQPNLQIVGEASNGVEAIQKARELKPDVILMDISMPGCSGLEATAALQRELAQIQILIITASEKEADLFAAIKAGAKGYILKNTNPEDLLQTINHVFRGEAVVCPTMATKLLDEFREARQVTTGPAAKPDQANVSILTSREREVLEQVARGSSNKEISAHLFITENTVKTHLKNIMEKLHLRSRSQAAAYAARLGVISAGN